MKIDHCNKTLKAVLAVQSEVSGLFVEYDFFEHVAQSMCFYKGNSHKSYYKYISLTSSLTNQFHMNLGKHSIVSHMNVT